MTRHPTMKKTHRQRSQARVRTLSVVCDHAVIPTLHGSEANSKKCSCFPPVSKNAHERGVVHV